MSFVVSPVADALVAMPYFADNSFVGLVVTGRSYWETRSQWTVMYAKQSR